MTTGVLKWRNGRVPDALTLSVEYPGYMRIGGGGYKSAMYRYLWLFEFQPVQLDPLPQRLYLFTTYKSIQHLTQWVCDLLPLPIISTPPPGDCPSLRPSRAILDYYFVDCRLAFVLLGVSLRQHLLLGDNFRLPSLSSAS
ncbi:hypothetical protein HZ326_5475 [Fusarium oxysporum f. sp. albedinis]|nr:hypothetical protein HZ326_5475 [Fusarium oxysporum f. sp. albedinis]